MNINSTFDSYVHTFLDEKNDPKYQNNIILKKDHSERVRREIVELCTDLGIEGRDLDLAEFMGLFHDIGRFEQFHGYGTFRDDVSEDHGALGVRVIQEMGFADHLNDEDRDLFLTAVELHNKARLPEDLPERHLWFAKLLRDADKLDIWKVVTDYYWGREERRNTAIELDLPDTPTVSEAVYQDIMEKKVVDFNHMRNLNDFKLLQLGWVFDLNFSASLRKVSERGYIEKIMGVLPNLPEVNEIYAVIRSHILEPRHVL